MSINPAVRQFLQEENEDVVLFENHAYDNAIIGVTDEGAAQTSRRGAK